MGEAVLIIIGLPIAPGPFLYAFYWVLSRRVRWDAGAEPLLARGDFSAAELACSIPHVNASLAQLIDRVNGLAASLGKPAVVRETSGTARLKAQAVKAAAWSGLVIAILLSINGSWFPAVAAAAVFPVLLLRSNKMLQPSLETLLAQDRRQPLLLLRSFGDDEIQAWRRFSTPVGDISLGRRFEQGIAGSLRAFGPLIAIGKPGEEVPQIGAVRAYLSDAEWQPAVLRWLDQALLIVMIAGATEWVTWELHRIVEKGRNQRLLILLPPGPNEKRWEHIVSSLAHTSWAAALQTIDIDGVLLIQLERDGNVLAIKRQTAMTFIQDYQLAMAIAIHRELCAKPT